MSPPTPLHSGLKKYLALVNQAQGRSSIQKNRVSDAPSKTQWAPSAQDWSALSVPRYQLKSGFDKTSRMYHWKPKDSEKDERETRNLLHQVSAKVDTAMMQAASSDDGQAPAARNEPKPVSQMEKNFN